MRVRAFEIQVVAPRCVALASELPPPGGLGDVLVQTLYSGISAGTERTYFEGTNPYMQKRWDRDARLFVDGGSTFTLPRTFGYMNVGVTESGGESLPAGTRVFGGWGHHSHCFLDPAQLRDQVIPDGVPLLEGLFLFKMGPIAYNGLLEAAGKHRGANVVVFGGGVVGLTVAQLARSDGARSVLVVDPNPFRRAVACELGVEAADPRACGDVALWIKRRRGAAGVAFEASGTYGGLREAIRTVEPGGTVVALGFYIGPAGLLCLGEEFHHNQVRLISTQIGFPRGTGAAADGLAPLRREFLTRVREGRVRLDRYVTHVLPAAEAQKAFDYAFYRHDEALQVVLQYPEEA